MPNGQYWIGRAAHDIFRDASENQVLAPAASMRPHRDEIDLMFVRISDDFGQWNAPLNCKLKTSTYLRVSASGLVIGQSVMSGAGCQRVQRR